MGKVFPVKITDNYISFDDNTCWPNPNANMELEWMLRNTEEEVDRYVLASFVNAYKNLIWMSKKDREYAVKKIQDALK